MNLTHLHLLMNHLPILGVPFALTLLAAGVLRKSEELKQAALIGFILVGILIVPVYLTGEPAEEAVENLPGVTEAFIEQHEDRALFSLVCTELLALVSLATLVQIRRQRPAPPDALLLVLGLVATISLGLTASAGGEVRHSEIRSQAWFEQTLYPELSRERRTLS